MNRQDNPAAFAKACASFLGWIDGGISGLIRRAARRTPEALCERLEEEWLAHLSQQRGVLSRWTFALGCYWAATFIAHDDFPIKRPALNRPVTGVSMTMTSGKSRGTLLPLRASSTTVHRTAICDINTTPLIDVMLVLVITLIVSLPIMTHAVKLDLPHSPPAARDPLPEVIDIDIDFDGTLGWNRATLASWQQLEGYLQSQAQKDPQPEIHLRVDRRAEYDVVARVLAAAQRNHMRKMGFVDTAEFGD
jgi:biopolymer transport protein ExbD